MKRLLQITIIFCFLLTQGQEVALPSDLRQHNLFEYNSSLFNPIFSSTANRAPSVAIWSRWQWQTIDTDPTTLFVNYTGKLTEESVFGVGLLKHGTGVHDQIGGVLNYSYTHELDSGSLVTFGFNLFGYSRTLAEENITPVDGDDAFILQFAPAVGFQTGGLSLHLISENLIDRNFATNEAESNSREKVFIGMIGYQIPVYIFNSSDAFIKPMVYLKSSAEMDNQYGGAALFSTPKFWLQGGYNNFYGVSGGIGARLFEKLSLGVLIETGTSDELEGLDPSYEVILAYGLGPVNKRKRAERLRKKKQREAKPEPAIVMQTEPEEPEPDTIDTEQRRQQAIMDSIAAVQKPTEPPLAENIPEVKEAAPEVVQETPQEASPEQEEVKTQEPEPQPPSRKEYEEIKTEEGIAPGYYLVVNVFKTQKYHDLFMKILADRTLNPKSFFRASNQYRYVYLERYDTKEEATRAKESQYNRRYTGEMWIFGVLPN